MQPENKYSFYKGKKILITGGLGFIGSNLSIALVSVGAHVTIIDACITDTGWNRFNIKPIQKDCDVLRANISSSQIIPFLKKTEYVFNLAGVLSHIDALKDPLHDLQINTVDQLKFLTLCLQHNPDVRIIYTGTRNQYGKAKKLPVREDHPFIPIDTNGVSEIASEHYHSLYWRLYGLRSTSIRLCNVFGPRHQMRHSRQGVLNWFIRLLLDKKKIQLMGTGKQIRDSIFVGDLIDALLLLGMSKDPWGEAYNIGSYPLSLHSFVQTAISTIGKGSYERIPFPADRLRIEPGDYIANSAKLRKLTGWKPHWKLEDAITATANYYTEYKEKYWT